MQQGPYFGQVSPISPIPAGYLEGAANIGRTFNQALSGLGDNIGKAIEQYQQNEQQRQVLGPQIGQFLKSDPSLVQEVDSKLLEKFQSGKASLDDHKALMGEITTNALLKQKKVEDERAKQANELQRLQIADITRRSNNDKLLGDALKMNIDTDGNVDINGALQTFIGGGGSLQDSGIGAALANIRGIQFGGPKASTVKTDSGRSIDTIETAPGAFHVLPEQKLEVPKPESPLGKMQSDRDNALLRGNQKDAEQLQSAIDSEVKKQAEGTGAKALTADQSNALNFSLRLMQNENFIAKNKFEPQAVMNGSWTPERFQSQDKKAYDAAKNNWIAAALRKESGAAISKDEYDQFDKQYFPQPGDEQDVISQKVQMRQQLTKGMITTIGPDADKYLSAGQYTPPAPSGPRKFNSAAEAEASGYKGAAEVFDPQSKKWRKAVIN